LNKKQAGSAYFRANTSEMPLNTLSRTAFKELFDEEKIAMPRDQRGKAELRSRYD
jgi:hypothetical protein